MNIDLDLITHVFFDVDGVLIHGFHYSEEYRNVWTKTLTEDLCIAENDLVQELFMGPWKEVIRGKSDLHGVLVAVLPRIGFKGDVNNFIKYWLVKDSNVQREVLDFICLLKEHAPDLSFNITTNQEHNRANYLWDVCGFSKSFDNIFYSGMLGVTKEEPDFFKAVMTSTNLKNPRAGLVIDDSPNVLNEAHRQGFQIFQFTEVGRSLSALRSIWGI